MKLRNSLNCPEHCFFMLELSEIKISKRKSELEDGTRYSTVNNYEAENSMKKKITEQLRENSLMQCLKGSTLKK